MAEYIEREDVERKLADIYMGLGGYKTRDAFYKAIDLVHRYPAADVAPVRHGWWVHETIEDDDWGGTYHSWSCSECKFSVGRNPTGENFCHKCGAKMDLEDHDGK